MKSSDYAPEYWTQEQLDASWKKFANCAEEDSSTFFPARGSSIEKPLEICSTCPVKIDCLMYSYKANVRDGIWGGLSNKLRIHVRQFYDNMGMIDNDNNVW